MTFWIGVGVGMFIGTMITVLIMSCLAIASDADDMSEKSYEARK